MSWSPLFAGAMFYWHLPFILVIVSLVYSATRHDEWDAIFREAWRWGARLAGFLIAVMVVLYVLARLA